MDPISDIARLNIGNLAAQNRQAQVQQAPEPQTEQPSEEATPAFSLTITPGENNAGPGEDRSDNTAVVSISTPERQVEFEVSREQAVDAAERRATRRAIGLLPGENSISPFTAAALAQADSRDDARAVAVGAAELQATRNTAQVGLDLFTNNNSGSNTTSGQTQQNSNTGDFYEIAVDAQAARQRQEVFTAVLENQPASGNFLDETV